ncbi:MAG: DUF1887 family CARF protein [Bacteroidetes bacterium]|nr:DUF1887 family CARF protein [Bacteroidota bacterium]
MSTIVCLVSRQVMQNVLPILMYAPRSVFLLTTEEEAICAQRIKNLCNQKRIEATVIKGIHAYTPVTVANSIKKIVQMIPQNEVMVNLTGGTKLMSIAAFETARSLGIPTFYCNTEGKEIIYLSPAEKREPLVAPLTIEEYLLAHGYTISEEKSMNEIKIFSTLFTKVELNGHFRSLAELFSLVHSKGLDSSRYAVSTKDKVFTFQKNYDAYVIQYNKQEQLKVMASGFNPGAWLEYWVYMKQNSHVNEIKTGVKVVSRNGTVNEVDVIYLKDYILHLISCKTGNFSSQEALHQLEALRILMAGTFGKGFLVVCGCSKGVFDRMKLRARELRIPVLDLSETNGEVAL